MPDTLGSLIKQVREAACLRPATAARRAGIDRRRWHDIESDRAASAPSAETLAKMLRALGIVPGSPIWTRARDLYAPALAGHDETTDGAVTP